MFSTQTRTPTSRPVSKDGAKKNIWDSMLAEAARGKELPEKQLLILGGTPDQQRELLEILQPEQTNTQYQRDRQRNRKAPISNLYALGYTYHDVLDADQEDILARLSIYMLSEPAPAFAPLLKPLLTSKTIPDTLIIILLNWSDPLKWPRQLRQWIRFLRSVLITLDDETKVVMEENMTEWKERRKGTEPASSNQTNGAPVIPPLGVGEWDEGLGVPLCVVCQNAEKMESLEKELGWQEEDFDFILQVMRTILLKHGSSMIYTSTFDSISAQPLIHSSLGIHSMLKRETIKHNVIDREKILVPPNWDSHGKIRIQREGFDPERVGTLWSVEIQDPPEELDKFKAALEKPIQPANTTNDGEIEEEESAVHFYESTLQQDPSKQVSSAYSLPSTQRSKAHEEITSTDMQSFLSQQLDVLEKLKTKDESDQKEYNMKFIGSKDQKDLLDEGGRKMAEQIGPVQFNMGGIQVDADDMLKRLKEREASRTPLAPSTPSRPIDNTQRNAPSTTATTTTNQPPSGTTPATPGTTGGGGSAQNEALASFFAGLMKNKGGGAGGSAAGSPRPPPPPAASGGT